MLLELQEENIFDESMIADSKLIMSENPLKSIRSLKVGDTEYVFKSFKNRCFRGFDIIDPKWIADLGEHVKVYFFDLGMTLEYVLMQRTFALHPQVFMKPLSFIKSDIKSEENVQPSVHASRYVSRKAAEEFIFMDHMDGTINSLGVDLTSADMDNILIQLMVGLSSIQNSNIKIMHNDLHGDNIFFQKRKSNDEELMLEHVTFDMQKKQISLGKTTKYNVKIGDWGFGCQYQGFHQVFLSPKIHQLPTKDEPIHIFSPTSTKLKEILSFYSPSYDPLFMFYCLCCSAMAEEITFSPLFIKTILWMFPGKTEHFFSVEEAQTAWKKMKKEYQRDNLFVQIQINKNIEKAQSMKEIENEFLKLRIFRKKKKGHFRSFMNVDLSFIDEQFSHVSACKFFEFCYSSDSYEEES